MIDYSYFDFIECLYTSFVKAGNDYGKNRNLETGLKIDPKFLDLRNNVFSSLQQAFAVLKFIVPLKESSLAQVIRRVE